jgi:isoleucyl-tRNA synthetase
MYEPVDPKASFPSMEEAVLAFWKERGIFEKSVSERDGAPEYVFYDGPPFATGLPHFGHFVPGTIKDIIPRYKTMKGFKVERRFGWDCHGLPVEYEMEKELGISGKKAIEDYGVANFNEACRSIVLRYTNEWRRIMTRAGRWVDFDNDYKTMDPDYMESIWWVVKRLWDEGLIYEGHYILPYCPRCSTVLSNHELQLGGYKDVHDPAVTIKFRVKTDSSGAPGLSAGNTFFLAWTTTPWTLPSNLALAVGSDVDYVLVEDGTERYIMAEARISAYYKDAASLKVISRMKGSALVGAVYEPLFPYFAETEARGSFRVHSAAYVTTEDGTGIVHTAPGFGEDDYQTLKGTGVPTVCPVDGECKFTAEVSDYTGRFVKDCDKDIIERLKAEGKLVKREQYLHAYPHCWRCSSPLIYRAISSWFVKIDPVKQKMLKANSSVYWMPGHIRDGRFGKWLENARDWAISRNRYWGNPLPIWKCDECGGTECIGSRDDLEKFSGSRPTDLHKHFVDEITWKCKKPGCTGTMKRIPEVLDCWFESGSMPYAQVNYPFQNKKHFEEHFPADFICEGLDQTRGWFYTLTILAAALFDKPAFKACVVNGLVLATDGKKMSKSLRNYTDPVKVIDEFGADALRIFLMHSAVTRGDDLCYSDEGVREVVKSILLPLWSAYGFYITYANIDKVEPAEASLNASNPMDRWILSKCETMVKDVGASLEAYDMQRSIDPMVDFIDALNNWYIRRSRRRFWRSENDGDKVEAYSTLYRVLRKLTLCLAPFAPFITETMWKNLRGNDAESVHLALFPEYDDRYRDEDLEWKMDTVRKTVTMGRSLRYQHNLKIRQPLAAVHLVTKDARERAVLLEMEDIIREELNVKEVVFRDDEEELVEYQAKANFRVLGKELGKDMKEGAAIVEKLEPRQIASLLAGATFVIEVAGRHIELTKEKVEVRRLEKASLRVVNEGTLTVALDAGISPALLDEGNARDLVRGVQTLRKDSGLAVTDRIELSVYGSDDLKRAFDTFASFVSGETLATTLRWEAVPGQLDIEAGDDVWKVALTKA